MRYAFFCLSNIDLKVFADNYLQYVMYLVPQNLYKRNALFLGSKNTFYVNFPYGLFLQWMSPQPQ